MNSASPSRIGIHNHARDRDHAHDHTRNHTQCIGMTGNSQMISTCKRRVVWEIIGTGGMCNLCFEAYFAANWKNVEIGQVNRLSDDERDFWVNERPR